MIKGFTSYMSLCVKANCSAPSGGDDQHYLSSFIQCTEMTSQNVIFFNSYHLFHLIFSQHLCSQSLLEFMLLLYLYFENKQFKQFILSNYTQAF